MRGDTLEGRWQSWYRKQIAIREERQEWQCPMITRHVSQPGHAKEGTDATGAVDNNFQSDGLD